MRTLLLVLNGLGFIATGVYAFVHPAQLAGLAGLSFSSGAAVSEFWANYGGLYLLYGLFLCWSVFSPDRQRNAVVVLLFTSVGLATGRVLGMALVAFPGWTQFSFLLWELISALLCVLCLIVVDDHDTRRPPPAA